MTKDKPGIFISSTFEDLAQYRQAVREAVLRAGAIPLTMEDQPAAGRLVEQKLRELLDRSDAVLLLVGHRYGTINSKTGKSWVENEYEAAKRRKKPLLAFLAAEDAPWPPKLIDPDRRRIEEFRQHIASDRVVQFFSGPDDLRFAVTDTLAGWVAALEKSSSDREPKRVAHKREIKIIRLLLSSPGDVAEERERVARAVFRFNQNAVEENGLFIKLVRWEEGVVRAFQATQEFEDKVYEDLKRIVKIPEFLQILEKS